MVGFLPPGDLVEPQPLALPVKNEQDATVLAANNNPTVVTALFNDAAAKDAVDVAFSQLLPQVSFQGQVFQQNNAGSPQPADATAIRPSCSSRCRSIRAARSIPRSARRSRASSRPRKLVDDARRTAVQNAVQAWETLVAAKGLGRQHAGGRSAPTRSLWKAWSARPSSAAAPRSTC